MSDLKTLSSTLNLLARQIDHVVTQIDSRIGSSANNNNNNNNTTKQQQQPHQQQFTKIISNKCSSCMMVGGPPTVVGTATGGVKPMRNHNEGLLASIINASSGGGGGGQLPNRSLSERKNNYSNYMHVLPQQAIHNHNQQQQQQQQHQQKPVEMTGFLKVKCPRSKSQPAFKDSNNPSSSSLHTNTPTTMTAVNSSNETSGIYGNQQQQQQNLNKYLGVLYNYL
jgi:phage FluMu protein Com